MPVTVNMTILLIYDFWADRNVPESIGYSLTYLYLKLVLFLGVMLPLYIVNIMLPSCFTITITQCGEVSAFCVQAPVSQIILSLSLT